MVFYFRALGGCTCTCTCMWYSVAQVEVESCSPEDLVDYYPGSVDTQEWA